MKISDLKKSNWVAVALSVIITLLLGFLFAGADLFPGEVMLYVGSAFATLFLVRWMLNTPKLRPFITRSKNPARDAPIAFSLLVLVLIPLRLLVFDVSVTPYFGDCPGKTLISVIDFVSRIADPVFNVIVSLVVYLFFCWGCHVIMARAADRRYLLRIVWAILNIMLIAQMFGEIDWNQAFESGLPTPGGLMMWFAPKFIWFPLAIFFLGLFAERFKAVVWTCSVFGSIGLLVLGLWAMLPQWCLIGSLALVFSGIEFIRALPLGEKVSPRWHVLSFLTLMCYVVGGIVEGCLQTAVDRSPYREEVKIGDDTMYLSDCLNGFASDSRQWVHGGGLPLYERSPLSNMSDCDLVDAIDFVDADFDLLRKAYTENWSGSWTNAAARIADFETHISDEVARVRRNAAALTWISFAIGMDTWNVGSGDPSPEMLIAANAVGKLSLADLLRGIESLAKSGACDRYSFAVVSREAAALTGLRLVSMRDIERMNDTQLKGLREFAKTKVASVGKLRIEALVNSFWTVLNEYEKNRRGICYCLGHGAMYPLQSYCACKLFEPRIRLLVEEYEKAAKENRTPVFDKPVLWPEFVATTIGDAYVALDLTLAVEQYRRAKGTLPESLDALVPEFIDKVPVCISDGTPFSYEKGELEMLQQERCPDNLVQYRQKDAAGKPVTTFSGYRISFKYARPKEDGPSRFTVPVLCSVNPVVRSGNTLVRSVGVEAKYQAEAIPVLRNLRIKTDVYQHEVGCLPGVQPNGKAGTTSDHFAEVQTFVPIVMNGRTEYFPAVGGLKYGVESPVWYDASGVQWKPGIKGNWTSHTNHFAKQFDVAWQDLAGVWMKPSHIQYRVLSGDYKPNAYAYAIGVFGDGNGLAEGTGYAIIEIVNAANKLKYIGIWKRYKSVGGGQLTLCTSSESGIVEGPQAREKNLCWLGDPSGYLSTNHGTFSMAIAQLERAGWEFVANVMPEQINTSSPPSRRR